MKKLLNNSIITRKRLDGKDGIQMKRKKIKMEKNEKNIKKGIAQSAYLCYHKKQVNWTTGN